MRAAASLLLLIVSPGIVAAQSGPAAGAVRGEVRDSAGRAIAGVLVAPIPSGAGTRTNDSGSYRLDGLPTGATRLTARRVGFMPETLDVVVRAGASARADFSMKTAATAIAADVIDADPLRGKMGPFNRRKSRGLGSFITRDEIEKRRAASVSELLRYLPGVGVSQRMAGEPQPVRMERSINTTNGECTVKIYVDGQPYPNGSVDDFDPLTLEGVEVYRSAAEIPADFRTRDATCGVIALWTRDPDAARKRPSS
jgi:Carboxypeptidase regulatory-like domain/TonB-dependent Receptor Plug Domain